MGHLNGFLAPRGGNLNTPILKSLSAPGVLPGGGDVELSKFSAHNQQHFSDFGLEWIYVPSTKDICIGG